MRILTLTIALLFVFLLPGYGKNKDKKVKVGGDAPPSVVVHGKITAVHTDENSIEIEGKKFALAAMTVIHIDGQDALINQLKEGMVADVTPTSSNPEIAQSVIIGGKSGKKDKNDPEKKDDSGKGSKKNKK